MASKIDHRLTSPAFWDVFWNQAEEMHFPIEPNPQLSYDRCFIETLNRYVRPPPGAHVFEVGCAPGKWLLFFHKTFGCLVAGCEFSRQGLINLEKNLASASISGEIFSGDFLEIDFGLRQYEIVMSYGFIEHFTFPERVIRRHVDLLKRGGTLILSVPNFRGVYRWLQDDEFLAAHNLDTMTKTFFQDVAKTHRLDTVFLGPIGRFEWALLDLRHKPGFYRWIAHGLSIVTRLPFLKSITCRLWSGYLIGIFKKRMNDR